MKKIFVFLVAFACLICNVIAQKKSIQNTSPTKPKLVVGIVIDQMRWDYLFRYQQIFKPTGGFKRMMNEGFNCNNTFIPYAPTVTACGHSCVYTGSVPNIHGITGNAWYDKQLNKNIYCTEDKMVETVGGSKGSMGQMSPKNMLTTTICDELKLSSNFKSKVIGVAIKDRGSILPAGHSADAAYWYDSKTGNFSTSTYYMKELPSWVNQFNEKKLPASLLKLGWQKSLKDDEYLQYASADEKEYEKIIFGKEQLKMPYNLAETKDNNYMQLSSTPHGNTLTAEMAKAAIVGENLGKGNYTDFLAVSFSSPDYIGHAFGPNSWENVDDYVKLDENLGDLLTFLDSQLGKGNYTVFLTADHAVAHIPAYLKENKIPAGTFDDNGIKKEMNKQLKVSFGVDEAVVSMYNYQVTLNHPKIDSAKADKKLMIDWIIDYLKKQESVSTVFDLDKLYSTPLNKTIREMIANGYYANRSGDIQFILKPNYIDGGKTGTTHGLWNPYDSHIPLIWYGWGINKGSSHKEVYMTDIAATVAALLKIQMPNGCVGKVIEEVIK